MGPSKYVGRVGGLAAALGIGVAVLTAPAAWAETDSSSSASGNTAAESAPERTDSPRVRRADTGAGSAARTRSGRVTDTSPADTSSGTDAPAALPAVDAPRRNRAASNGLPGPAAATRAQAAGDSAAAPVPAASAATLATAPAAAPAADSEVAAAPAAALPAQVTLPPVVVSKLTSLLPTKPIVLPAKPAPNVGAVLAKVADRVTTAINTAMARIVESMAGGSPFGPAAQSPIQWLMLAIARRQAGTAATTDEVATQGATATPVLVLNGYNVVATSPLYATSFYGPFASWPGYKGIQGAQEFDLVDPATNETVGSFTGLALYDGTGKPGKGSKLIVVTDVLSGEEGSGPGQTPPKGSVLAVSGGNGVTSGNVYTDMPPVDGQGEYTKQYYAITRFGNLPLFTQYHAAETLTDYQSSNQPVYLTDGFYLAPDVPSSEVFTAADGLPPLFMVMQGTQTYSVYDESTGNPVGNFEALLTTTSDFFGIDTKMIRVTDTLGSTNVGIDPGQVPPVGTTYNVVYFNKGKSYLLYESAPTPSGDQVSVLLVTPRGVTPLGGFKLNATTPPPLTSVEFPGGVKFVPSSDPSPVVGVNGLPPREMITQGYQQFDVYNFQGTKIGNVNAYVTRQWDGNGAVQNQIMVVNINEGTPGLEYDQVPAVGSVYTTRQLVAGGWLTQVYSARPSPAGDYVVEYIVTPLGNIPLSGTGSAAVDADDVVFFDPYRRLLNV